MTQLDASRDVIDSAMLSPFARKHKSIITFPSCSGVRLAMARRDQEVELTMVDYGGRLRTISFDLSRSGAEFRSHVLVTLGMNEVRLWLVCEGCLEREIPPSSSL